MTAHAHASLVDGCYRCDLNLDELPGPHECDALDVDWADCEECGARHRFCSTCGAEADSCNGCANDRSADGVSAGQSGADDGGIESVTGFKEEWAHE